MAGHGVESRSLHVRSRARRQRRIQRRPEMQTAPPMRSHDPGWRQRTSVATSPRYDQTALHRARRMRQPGPRQAASSPASTSTVACSHVVQPPAARSRFIRGADLPRQCHGCHDQKRGSRQDGRDQQLTRNAGSPRRKQSHVTPVGVRDQRDQPDCENRSEEGLERKNDHASHNRHHGVFDDQQCPPRSVGKGEQHTAAIASTLSATMRNQRFSSVRVCLSEAAGVCQSR
jgi:hypothetical protein